MTPALLLCRNGKRQERRGILPSRAVNNFFVIPAPLVQEQAIAMPERKADARVKRAEKGKAASARTGESVHEEIECARKEKQQDKKTGPNIQPGACNARPLPCRSSSDG